MTQLRIMATSGGKHPASKWAEFHADEIVNISEQAPATLIREAKEFRNKLVEMLTKHHQQMMEHEQDEIKAGRHGHDLPFNTEEYAKKVREQICDVIAKGTSFAEHFQQNHVKEWVEGICNKYFKSSKMVERQHFHSEQEKNAEENTEKPGTAINRKKKA